MLGSGAPGLEKSTMRRGLLRAASVLELFGVLSLSGCTENQARDSWPDATGFFEVAEVGERCWLITPEGEPFYSVGVNDVDPRGDTDQETGMPYEDFLELVTVTNSRAPHLAE